ncbi:MAG: hypothetical protein PWQ39_747 [Thermacetogenium sp.]|nr:hypothetical protein [Thermacetogenium sp.]
MLPLVSADALSCACWEKRRPDKAPEARNRKRFRSGLLPAGDREVVFMIVRRIVL